MRSSPWIEARKEALFRRSSRPICSLPRKDESKRRWGCRRPLVGAEDVGDEFFVMRLANNHRSPILLVRAMLCQGVGQRRQRSGVVVLEILRDLLNSLVQRPLRVRGDDADALDSESEADDSVPGSGMVPSRPDK